MGKCAVVDHNRFMTVNLTQITSALNQQWARTIAWLEPLGPDLHGQEHAASSAAGWSIGELITHMGLAMDVLISAQPATHAMSKLNLAEYLRSYSDQSLTILERSKEADQSTGAARLNFLTSQAHQAKVRLHELGQDPDLVLQTFSAILELRDLAASSLIEVVVHSLDLEKSFTGTVDMTAGRGPVDPDALKVVGQLLLEVLAVRGATGLEVVEPRAWVLLATGRAPHTSMDLAQALQPTYTAGGIEDLSPYLPVT